MSEIMKHYDRLTDDGCVTLRDLAGQITRAAEAEGRDLAGTDWRAEYVTDPLAGPFWQVETSVFIEEIDDLVFTPERLYGAEFNFFLEARLRSDEKVWFADRIEVTA